MKIISVINYKGGVGKTTLTANVGAELAYRGYRVLLVDLDAQASLTFSFVKPDYWKKNLADGGTIKDWFDSFSERKILPLQDSIITPSDAEYRVNGKLDLIPSHLGLINVDLELATELSGATLRQSKQNYLKVHQRLANGFGDIDNGLYDFVLIDCPPNFNVVTKTAIVASEHILIPAKPDYLSTLGIDYLLNSVDQLIHDFNEYVALGPKIAEKIGPSILGVVFTMISRYGGQPIAALRPFIAQTKKLGVPVFKTQIRENKTLFGEAPQYGVPVVLTRQSTGTYGDIVTELEELTSEILKRIGEKEK